MLKVAPAVSLTGNTDRKDTYMHRMQRWRTLRAARDLIHRLRSWLWRRRGLAAEQVLRGAAYAAGTALVAILAARLM